MNNEELLEFEQIKKKVLNQLRSGEWFDKRHNTFPPFKGFLNEALKAKIESNLEQTKFDTDK